MLLSVQSLLYAEHEEELNLRKKKRRRKERRKRKRRKRKEKNMEKFSNLKISKKLKDNL
jgi:hypothetical protein